MSSKCCSRCKAPKPLIDFYKQTASKDGLSPWCIECYNESRRNREYRPITVEEKRCSDCNRVKSIASFGRRGLSKDGLNSKCLVCNAKYHRSLRLQKKTLRRKTLKLVCE